jgi:glycosyltransferase involved in cell wall biosynthesis
LDLLIDALKNSNELFELHIVGGGYQQFAEACAGDERFIFHGMRDRDYCQRIFAQCDIGIGTLALERKGMKEACPLKVREYLASGLPVYAGHQDGALPDDFPFYKKGTLEVEAILNYAKKCRQVSREEIRKQATLYIDKKQLMLYLAQWIEKQI